MANVADLYSEIRRSARGIPEPTMRDALIRAARLFCKNSWYIRRSVSLTLDPTQSNPAIYTITTPDNEEPLNILRGSITYPNGYQRPLASSSAGGFNPNAFRNSAQPRWYAFTPTDTVTFYPVPDQAYVATLLVPTQPVRASMAIPDEIAENYNEGIGYGALSWLFRMRGSEWYDAQESLLCQADFWREVNKAKVEALRDFKTQGLRVDPVQVVSIGWGSTWG